jgi:glycosyltransferase involved in cell wall biosynthesis
MRTKPAVSINLCCYNSEKYLRETLDSIVNQTYKDWELVVINDGSTDSTEDIIYEYIKKGYPIIYHYQENKGLGYSRNEALKRSQGEFIAFIDHDDLWIPEKLEKQIPLFHDLEVGLVFSNAIIFNEKGKSTAIYEHSNYSTGRCFSELLANYFLNLQTVVIRKSVLSEITDWFNPIFNMVEEADLFLRIAYKWKIDMINIPLAKTRVHQSSLTVTRGYLIAEEYFVMLNDFKKLCNDFDARYAKELFQLKRSINIIQARNFLKCGRSIDARRCLTLYNFTNWKATVTYILTFFPDLFIRQFMKYINRVRTLIF